MLRIFAKVSYWKFYLEQFFSQLKLITIKILLNNQCYTIWNILKIICNCLVMLVALMCSMHISCAKILDHILIHFTTKHYEIVLIFKQIVMDGKKCILYNSFKCNQSNGIQNEPLLIVLKASLNLKKLILHI